MRPPLLLLASLCQRSGQMTNVVRESPARHEQEEPSELLREAGRETGRDCAPDASRATGRRRSSVGSVPMTMRPSRRGELTGGGVVVSNDGRRAPVDALESGSLYADHTSVLSELSRSRPLSFAPITMRRVG